MDHTQPSTNKSMHQATFWWSVLSADHLALKSILFSETSSNVGQSPCFAVIDLCRCFETFMHASQHTLLYSGQPRQASHTSQQFWPYASYVWKRTIGADYLRMRGAWELICCSANCTRNFMRNRTILCVLWAKLGWFGDCWTWVCESLQAHLRVGYAQALLFSVWTFLRGHSSRNWSNNLVKPPHRLSAVW